MVKRYLHPHVLPAALEAQPELYEPILRALVDSGTALEVNTSGLRYAVGVTFPHPAIVARFHELGGRAITIGSDAHAASSFAWGLADGYGDRGHGRVRGTDLPTRPRERTRPGADVRGVG